MAKKRMTEESTSPSMPSGDSADPSSPAPPSRARMEETVTISKNMLFGMVIVALAVLLAASLFTGGFGLVKTGGTGNANNVPTPAPSPNPSPTPAPSPLPATLSTIQVGPGTLPLRGQATAPVTFIEFSDFQCPFCGRFYEDTETRIAQEYVGGGKVKFYYRDYPIPQLHRYATTAAMAARCANEQGKFWEYHDLLFQNQGSWSGVSEDQIQPKLTAYARQLDMGNATFATCLSSQKYASAVQQDIQDAQSAYGSALGTPTFFILIPKEKVSQGALTAVLSASPYYQQGYMGLKQTDKDYVVIITGALPYDSFKSVLDAVNY